MELIRCFATEFGQTPPQLFKQAHPPRRLHIQRGMPWRAAEPAATSIQASARRWLARHHFEERAVTFFFNEAVFRSTSTPSLEVPPIDVLQRTANGLHLAYSKPTADWMVALTSSTNDPELEVCNFLKSCFRSDGHRTHHPSERHPFAIMLIEFACLATRLFDHKSHGPASRMSAISRLKALSAVMQLGVKHTHAFILNVLPPLQMQSRSKVVHTPVLDEVTSRPCSSLIMPLIRDVHKADDAVYAERVTAFAELRPHHFGAVANLPRHFWLGSDAGTSYAPCTAAIRALSHLAATYSTRRKLSVLMRVPEATQQQVWSHHGVSSIEEQTHADNYRLRLAADAQSSHSLSALLLRGLSLASKGIAWQRFRQLLDASNHFPGARLRLRCGATLRNVRTTTQCWRALAQRRRRLNCFRRPMSNHCQRRGHLQGLGSLSGSHELALPTA